MKNKLTGVEAWRGVAAFLVVCMHARDHLVKAAGPFPGSDLFAFGHAGVDFFFVLSGFIILHIHAGDVGRPAALGHYLRRRFTRVYPFYWVVFLLALLALAMKHAIPPVPDLFSSALLLPLPAELPVPVAWSLLHEIVFYALFATLIINRRAGVVLLGAWLALIVAGMVGDPSAGGLTNVHSVFDCEFFLGMVAAGLLRWVRVPYPRVLLLFGTVAFFGVGIAEDFGVARPLANTTHLGYGVAAMLAVLGVVEAERQGKLRAPRLLVVMGGASYALYLTHLFTIGVLWQALRVSGLAAALPPWIEFVGFAAAAVAVGWVASRAVELPATALARRLLARAGNFIAPRTQGITRPLSPPLLSPPLLLQEHRTPAAVRAAPAWRGAAASRGRRSGPGPGPGGSR